MRKRSIGRLPRSEQGRSTVTKSGGGRHARLCIGRCSRKYSQTHTRAPLCELKLDPSREATEKREKERKKKGRTSLKAVNGERDTRSLCEFEMLFFSFSAHAVYYTRRKEKKKRAIRFCGSHLLFNILPFCFKLHRVNAANRTAADT